MILLFLLNLKEFFYRRYNWISKVDSKKRFCFSSGKYCCVVENCSIKEYHAEIVSRPVIGTVFVKILWNHACNHEKVNLLKNRCSGEERERTKLEIMSKGIHKVQSENELFNLQNEVKNSMSNMPLNAFNASFCCF